jgi:hypothetical protein
MGFRLVDRLLASNIDFLRGNNYHIFVARPDFLQEKRLVLNHGIAQWCYQSSRPIVAADEPL